MTHRKLCLEEREKFYALKQNGKSFREIGRILGRAHTDFSRDYRENTKYFQQYIPWKAQARADKRAREQRTKAPLKNVEVFLYVREELRKKRTPEAISGRIGIDLPGQSIDTETIYRYIYGKGKEFKLWEFLPEKHRRRRVKTNGRKVYKKHKSNRIVGARSIEERPHMIQNRRQVGHFETDLMEGTRKDQVVITVEVERKTRYIVLTKLNNKKAETKTKKVQEKLKMIQSLSTSRRPLVKTITTDNGSENALHKDIERNLNVEMYFCHAYHSWEKGSVENSIKRLRRYIPKGTEISKYSDEDIQVIENDMNNTPRKCLNYMTPNEALEKEANKYKFRVYKSNLI